MTLGTPVWIQVPESENSDDAFREGEIISLENKKVKVKYSQGKTGPAEVDVSMVFPKNDYKFHPDGYDDMVDMENLSDAELLYNVQKRFVNDQIFTYVGPTLLVLNPYRKIDALFTEELLRKFQDGVLNQNFDLKDHPPHVWAIAADTMLSLIQTQKNQAIVISGESGAGKTENTKFCMKFLTSISNKTIN